MQINTEKCVRRLVLSKWFLFGRVFFVFFFHFKVKRISFLKVRPKKKKQKREKINCASFVNRWRHKEQTITCLQWGEEAVEVTNKKQNKWSPWQRNLISGWGLVIFWDIFLMMRPRNILVFSSADICCSRCCCCCFQLCSWKDAVSLNSHQGTSIFAVSQFTPY